MEGPIGTMAANTADLAATFLKQFARETAMPEEKLALRLREAKEGIALSGTYTHTFEELEFGAKLAWRNNARCIGRLFWSSLHVIDARELSTPDEVAEALLRHIAFATNEGRIRPVLTAFAPKAPDGRQIRIWNHQLIRYAGYRTEEGGMIGDPASISFTRACERLGWQGAGTPFDVLPLVVQVGGEEPRMYPIPDTLVREVRIEHPEHQQFQTLGLKWYAVPILSDMALEIGGLRYTAAPFNGWYMGTEIGARNLADADRYDMLPKVADALGYDRSSNATLWKDRALVELNAAVLHSYKRDGVSIVDHHTAADQFMRFLQKEATSGRSVNGRWSWLIPPMSPAATPIWHTSWQEEPASPDFQPQTSMYDS